MNQNNSTKQTDFPLTESKNKQMKPKYQIVEQIINHCFKDSNYFNNLFSFFATLDFSIERHYDKEDDEHYGFMKLDLTTYNQYKLFYTSDPDLQLLDKDFLLLSQSITKTNYTTFTALYIKHSEDTYVTNLKSK